MQQVLLSIFIIYCALMESIRALKPVIKAAVFDLDGTLLGMYSLYLFIFTYPHLFIQILKPLVLLQSNKYYIDMENYSHQI